MKNNNQLKDFFSFFKKTAFGGNCKRFSAVRKMFYASLYRKKNTKDNSALNSGAEAAIGKIADSNEELNAIISLSKELDLCPINLSKYRIDTWLLRLIPEEVAHTYQMIPLAKIEQGITVAVSDPFNIMAVDTIKSLIKADIYLVLAAPSDIINAIDKFYAVLELDKKNDIEIEKSDLSSEKEIQIRTAAFTKEKEEDINEITKISQESPVIAMVNEMFSEAIKRRASDIHIEPYTDQMRLRYRIDGILHEVKSFPKDMERALIARIKIMSKLDITRRRIPQDGRLSLILDEKDIDCRVSILPISGGEKIVLRLLEKSGLQVDLEKLGFSPSVLEAFTKAMGRPHGMILFTGPTGSGKSTTLYALLNKLDRITKNIITLEDPVEYQMQGITQIQMRPEIGLTFASSLRAVLRQNPNVIMVGEIRDSETVDIAMKAALTGHLILSTLHTNDAPSAVTRLINMQVEPLLISATLSLIAAQRLCRRICESCKESFEVSVEGVIGFPADVQQKKVTLYRGKGCEHCNNTGYFGRIPVVQALLIDNIMREMILKRASIDEVRQYAHSKDMRTLREDGIDKVLKGDIALEEVLRITPEG